MSGYLLDANVLIDWLDGKPKAQLLLERLGREEQSLAVNALTIAEVYSGIREEDLAGVDRLVSHFDYWMIDREVARLAGALRYTYARKGRPLAVADTLLAAHALVRKATLVTGNVRDFPMPELRVVQLDH